MRELWAIFADDPGAPMFTSILIGEAERQGQTADVVFQGAARTGKLLDRELRSMWITDLELEQGRVAIKAYGSSSLPIPTTPRTEWA